MGRAFEFRKARKMKRWSAMAKTFTRIGKDIVMAVKEGGPDAENNSRLRAVIQNAKAANMPKENVERAIKKASDKETGDFKEVLFEGYAPHGIAVLVETATDNNNRTVANIRSYFNKANGNLGTAGSVEFMFDHSCNFRIDSTGLDPERLNWNLLILGLKKFLSTKMECCYTPLLRVLVWYKKNWNVEVLKFYLLVLGEFPNQRNNFPLSNKKRCSNLLSVSRTMMMFKTCITL